MNIKIDTVNKVIVIIEITDTKGFVKFLKRLPNWKEYKITAKE